MGLIILGMALMIVLERASDLFHRKGKTGTASAAGETGSGPAASGKEEHAWGRLDFVKITIERPDEFISLAPTPPQYRDWFFPNYNAERLGDLINSCDFSAAARAYLLDQTHWSTRTNGVVITKNSDIVMEMSPATRQKIYTVLSESTQNLGKFTPYSFRPDGFEEWFANSGVSEATVALVRKLLYKRGNSICFSDLDEVFEQVPSAHERKRLVKTLSRKPTLLMKLSVREDSNIDQLVAYWGKGGTAKDIKPLLEALAKVPGGGTIDISHLLPSFARMRLYTYPLPAEVKTLHEDCFWTTMNFFKDQPDNKFADVEVTGKILQSDYYPIPGDPSYGDVILMANAEGTPIHAAIYLAEDVVFTKNGVNYNQPWILMRMADLMANYPSEHGVHVVVLRAKHT